MKKLGCLLLKNNNLYDKYNGILYLCNFSNKNRKIM